MAAFAAPRGKLLPVGLAFMAGCVDTVGFVAVFGLFTAHVTGNFVLIGSVLARSSCSVLLRLLVFPAFIAAVAATRLIVLRIERRHLDPLVPLLLLQFALLGGFAVLGWVASPIVGAEEAPVIGAGICGAAAVGIQNAVARLVQPSLAPTTVMTGNVTQLVIDGVDLLRGAAETETRSRGAKFLWPIVAFAGGAGGGAFGIVHAGFVAVAVPILVLLMLALTSATISPAVGTRPS